MTKIITFEGIDGTGKGTQMGLFYAYLTQKGRNVGQIGFPEYGSFFGAQVGRYLSAAEGVPADTVDSKSMALWFALDRFKAFAAFDYRKYDILLINRYALSNAVYQSIRDVDLRHPVADFYRFIDELEYVQLGIPRPDMELIFDMDTGSAARNVEKKGYRDYIGSGKDVYEAIPDLQSRARARYREYAQLLPNAVFIDCIENGALMPAERILEQVVEATKPLIG